MPREKYSLIHRLCIQIRQSRFQPTSRQPVCSSRRVCWYSVSMKLEVHACSTCFWRKPCRATRRTPIRSRRSRRRHQRCDAFLKRRYGARRHRAWRRCLQSWSTEDRWVRPLVPHLVIANIAEGEFEEISLQLPRWKSSPKLTSWPRKQASHLQSWRFC